MKTMGRKPPPDVDPWVRRRMYVAAGLLSLLFVGIGYRAYGLQVERHQYYRDLARRQHVRSVAIPAPRGPIHDATGRELAVTAEVDSISADPRSIVDVAGTAEALAKALDLDVRELEARLASRRHFVWVKRHVTPTEAEAVRALGLHGVEMQSEPRRYYPLRELAGTVLGFADIDGKGIEGVERSMNALLRGGNSEVAGLRDASGRVALAEGPTELQAGATVVLTLHRSIQFIAERALETAMREHDARAGTVVVLDTRTAEILAIANAPNYNPNDPAADARRGARNRAITEAYEIGSVMKIFTIAAALDAGVVTPTTTFNVNSGRYRIGRKVIQDSYRDKILNVTGIFKRSSNVGTVKVAQILGAEKLYGALRAYGFARKTGVELPGERRGLLRRPERWSNIELATVAFGYSVSTTALQVAAGVAAIGNDGVYHEPRIIREVRDVAGPAYQHQPLGRRIMKAKTAKQMRAMMRTVFERGRNGGTARSVVVPGYRAGGKTGTAEKLDPKTHEYTNKLHLSSFAGLAPIDDPRIAVVVVIDEPRSGQYYGASVAGPVFATVVSETLRYLGVPASDDPSGKGSKTTKADDSKTNGPNEHLDQQAPHRPIADANDSGDGVLADAVRVPDLRGLSKIAVLRRAREAGISVSFEGSGRAVTQAPAPGWAPKPVECRVIFSQSLTRP